EAGRRHHRIGTLPGPQLRRLDDAVERHLAGAPVDGEDGFVAQVVDRVVAPFSGRDHRPVDAQNLVELTPIEGDRAVEALAPRFAERYQYPGPVPILHFPHHLRIAPASP